MADVRRSQSVVGCLYQGKRSATIDTHTDEGRRQVANLIASSGKGGGIVLTNLPAAGWRSYEQLSKVRDDLIMVVITGTRDGGSAPHVQTSMQGS